MTKMILITYERYKHLKGTYNEEKEILTNIGSINRFKEKILSMFNSRDRHKITSIITFMNDIAELGLDDGLNITISGRPSSVHITDFLNDNLYPGKRQITPAYKEIYSILQKNNIPNKLINKNRRQINTLELNLEEDEKWVKY